MKLIFTFLAKQKTIVLISCSLVFLVLALVFRDSQFAGGLLSNLAAGFINTLIIVLLIEEVESLRASEKANGLRMMAFRRLRSPLVVLTGLICSMVKASHDPRGFPSKCSLKEFLSPERLQCLNDLDLYADSGELGKAPWAGSISAISKNVSRRIEIWLDRYIQVLDEEDISAVEDLINDPALRYMVNLEETVSRMHKENVDFRVSILVNGIDYNAFVARLFSMVKRYADLTGLELPISNDVFRHDHAPLIGSARRLSS